MANGDIHREGASGNQAGNIKGAPKSVPVEQNGVHALTAVRDSDSDLKLITWKVLQTGAVDRLKDSGNRAGRTSNISLAHVVSDFDFYVTGVSDSGGNEKLISWRVEADGAVGRAEDSGNQGLDGINGISVAGRDSFNNVISGVWDANRKLRVTSWRMNLNGQFDRLADSGNQAGEIEGPPELIALSNGLLVTAVSTKESTLKLISWRIEDDGDVKRLHDSGDQAGEIHSLPTAVVTAQGLIVTAVSDSNSNLKLISWEVRNNGTIHRRGDSGNQGGKAFGPQIGFTRRTSMFVTAVQGEEDRLLLSSWSVSADGRTIEKMGDSGRQAGVITEGPAIHPSDHVHNGFITAVRERDGDLKLISWTVEPF